MKTEHVISAGCMILAHSAEPEWIQYTLIIAAAVVLGWKPAWHKLQTWLSKN